MKISQKIAFCLTLIACRLSCGQTSPADDAMFAKYQVPLTFHGPIAKTVLTDQSEHMFRTRIRDGAAKGPVFADHYAVAVWGCGTSCISFALINSKTGVVYMAPFSVSGFAILHQGIHYRRNSRALHVVGELNEANPADRWYVWNGKKLDLVSEEPAKPDPEMQP